MHSPPDPVLCTPQVCGPHHGYSRIIVAILQGISSRQQCSTGTSLPPEAELANVSGGLQQLYVTSRVTHHLCQAYILLHFASQHDGTWHFDESTLEPTANLA